MAGPSKQSLQQIAGLAPRKIVVDWLFEVFHRQKPLDELFSNSEASPLWQELSARDRGFARSIVMTVLRHKGELDWVVAQFLKKKPQAKSRVYEILLSGAAQLLFMDVEPHAAIDMSVRLSKTSDKSRHLAKLVNAILRQISREGATRLQTQNSDELNVPELWRKRWRAQYGEDCAALILNAVLQPAALDIAVKQDEAGFSQRLEGVQLPFDMVRRDHRGLITELDGFLTGEWWVQDFAAHLPTRLFGDVKGLRVADLCAAPGGKTASLINQGADVVAVDISKNRLRRSEENLARLQMQADIKTVDVLEYEPEQPFDAVLLDAPCSATGTIRRHPDILYLKDEKQIFELARLQREMLQKSIEFVKPGGLLIYCTCSLEKEEGELQIERFLDENQNVKRVPVQADEIFGQSQWLTEAGDLRLFPHFTPPSVVERDTISSGMDGFFISRLRVG